MKNKSILWLGTLIVALAIAIQLLLVIPTFSVLGQGGIVKSMTPTLTKTLTTTPTSTGTPYYGTQGEDETLPSLTPSPTDEGLEFPIEGCIYVFCIMIDPIMPPVCPIYDQPKEVLCKEIWTPTPTLVGE